MAIDKKELDANLEELVFRLLYQDRLDDEMIPKGMIENSIKSGDLSTRYIVERFSDKLLDYLS